MKSELEESIFSRQFQNADKNWENLMIVKRLRGKKDDLERIKEKTVSAIEPALLPLFAKPITIVSFGFCEECAFAGHNLALIGGV